MDTLIYGLLKAVGYNHPLHAVLTHLVIGPVIAAFVFSLIAFFFKKTALYRTARHLNVLAFVFWFFTALMGVIDWIHFFRANIQMTDILIKMAIASVLFVILIATMLVNARVKEDSKLPVLFYGLSVICVVVLGFFGANLVYTSAQWELPAKTEAMTSTGNTVATEGFKKAEKDGFVFSWKVNGPNLDIAVSFATTGWLGVGFGTRGTMMGSDIKIGYVKDGKAVVLDSFGNDQGSHESKETLGGKNTVTNVSGIQESGSTTLRFTRPLDSGDKNDVVLVPGKSYTVILAHGEDGATDFLSYHGGGRASIKITL